MSKGRFSAEQLCEMYPEKYIAVNHIRKNDENIIIGAEVLKVYDTLEDCKKNVGEVKFFMKLYKEDFDIIYGDYEDYVHIRKEIKPSAMNVIQAFGGIALRIFGPEFFEVD